MSASSTIRPSLAAVGASILILALGAGCRGYADLDTPRQYPCNRQAANLDGPPQCPAGWRCGIEDPAAPRCRPHGEPRPYRCEQDRGDCSEGWTCAPDGFCRERLARADSCLRDVDCARGWICGADNVCRDASENAPYRCSTDVHCVPSWRCGGEGRCVDPSLDALILGSPRGSLGAAQLVSPARPGLPDHLGSEQDSSGQNDLSLVQDGGLHTFRVWTYPTPPSGILPTSPASTRPAPNGTLGVAVSSGHTYVLHATGLQVLAPDGGTLAAPALAGMSNLGVAPFTGPTATQTATIHAWDGNRVLLAEHHPAVPEVRLYDLAATGTGSTQQVPSGSPVRDLLYSTATRSELFVATDRGLYVREIGGTGTWLPVATGPLVHDDCPGQGGVGGLQLRVTRIVAYSPSLRAALASAPNGSTHLLRLGRTSGGDSPCTGFSGSSRIIVFDSCVACARGAGVEVSGGDALTNQHTFLVRCRDGATESTNRIDFANPQQCSAAFADSLGPQLTRPARGATTARAMLADDRGRPWLPVSGPLTPETAPESRKQVLLDRIPSSVVALPGTLAAFAAGREFRLHPVLGWVGSRPTSEVRTAGGAPVLVFSSRVLSSRLQDGSGALRTLATLEPNAPLLRDPARAQLQRSSDGTDLLLVSSFDTLLAADVTGPLAGTGQVAALLPRIVPSPGLPVRGLIALPSQFAPQGALAAGYLFTDNQVHFFQAKSAQRWESRPIDAPDGDWLELWMDQGRGRLGYVDGRVYALPSRLQIAPPLSPRDTVSSFVGHCGRSYAIATGGLYRLEPTVQALGEWVKETLPAGPPDALAGRRLYSVGTELLVFDREGTSWRIPTASCP